MNRGLLLLLPLAIACTGEIYRVDPKGPAPAHMHNHVEPPPAYAGRTSPLRGASLEAGIEAGEALYQQHCLTCHGRAGRGDGPIAASLQPRPADLAEHGPFASDAYWFWRIREGGQVEPFDSEMPAWKDELSEEQTWQVLAYCKTLSTHGAADGGVDSDAHIDEAPHGDAGVDQDAHIDEAPHP